MLTTIKVYAYYTFKIHTSVFLIGIAKNEILLQVYFADL